jgi:hypothetical protein
MPFPNALRFDFEYRRHLEALAHRGGQASRRLGIHPIAFNKNQHDRNG